MSMFKKLFKWLPFGRVPEMNATKVYEQLNKGNIQVLDVRTKLEWDTSHIDGSVNLPITQLSTENINSLQLSKTKTTLVICLSAHRSIPGVRKLTELGFDDVYQLKGGMLSWWRSKLPTRVETQQL